MIIDRIISSITARNNTNGTFGPKKDDDGHHFLIKKNGPDPIMQSLDSAAAFNKRMVIYPRYVAPVASDSIECANSIDANVGAKKRIVIMPIRSGLLDRHDTEFFRTNKNSRNLFGNLTCDEAERVIKSFSGDSIYTLKSLLNDGKPAALIACKDDAVGAFEKFNSDEIETIVMKGAEPDDNRILILNKNAVKRIIKDNFEFFALRLGMYTGANEDTLYEKLFHSDIVKNFGIASAKMNDLTGIVLGYPKMNSVIFNLETCIPKGYVKDRKRVGEFKQSLTNVLKSDASPYRFMGEKFNTEVQSCIDSIKKIKSSKDVLKTNSEAFQFIYYFDEPEEIKRIESYR